MDWYSRLKLLANNPRRIVSVYDFVAERLNSRINEHRTPPKGQNVMDADWDTLLLLDGCRYNLFESTCELSGSLSSVRSRGSFSEEFLSRNFTDKKYHDTVYVTANPYSDIIDSETFHYVVDVLNSDWDSELGTVPPEVMREKVQQAHEKYPEKRIIGHFMQPHYPFLGDTAQRLEQSGINEQNSENANPDIWRQLQFRFDNVTSELVWKAYQETLEITLDTLTPWVTEIEGKVVLSSDHGNLIGEWIGPIPARGYGHPPSIFHDALLTVPWFELPYERRRTIKSDPPTDHEIHSTTAEQLSDLGYY